MTIKTSNYIAAEKFIKETIDRNGFSAVIGEKGSGKSHLLRQIIGSYENKGGFTVIPITPMSEDVKSITQIMSAMIEDISGESPRRDVEARRRQLRRILGDTNKKIILAIDEAQDLHKSTIRGLKKIHELSFATNDKLFSIILFGQDTLKDRISDDELRPRIKRHLMKELTEKEKLSFIDTSQFNEKALQIFIKSTRKTPLSVISSYENLLMICEDLERKKIDEQITGDYFYSNTREALLALNMSCKKIADEISAVTEESVSATAVNQYMNGKYPGRNERLDRLANKFLSTKQTIAQ
ncbi:MAG: ATP-binding protein [Leptospirales bacterium]|nr:ATP-binding protein [Leptospirales bacterium]